jgi:hypothetical protein
VASGGVGEQAADLAGCGAEELAMLVDLVDRPVGERSMEAAFQAAGSSLKTRAWSSKRRGTEASPSSRTRSIGSSRLVMPILTTWSPKEPMLLMT